jgi:integrase
LALLLVTAHTLLPYGERSAPDDPKVEAYDEATLRQFFASLTDERHRLYFETLLKVGLREREATTLEWGDFTFGANPTVTIQARKPYLNCRVKTGKGRVVPLERNLALKLSEWPVKNPNRKLVFGTAADKEDSHFFRTAVEGFKRAGLPVPHRPVHRFRYLRHVDYAGGQD